MPAPDPPPELAQLLALGQAPWMVEPGIWSVLPRSTPPHRYDARVKAYDLVVGSPLYNRVLWGSSSAKYSRFADTAVSAGSGGWHLDAGCGSLLFSATAYARHGARPVVLLDHSLAMLRRARSRLEALAPLRKAPLLLLHADLQHSPFRAGSFETVLSMGVLHLFPRVEQVLGGLHGALTPAGALFLSTLVLARGMGNAYLRFLHLTGEIASPRTAAEVRALVQQHLGGTQRSRRKGNMLFIEARTAAA